MDLSYLDSLLVTLIIATLVGARLGHCLFYQPDYYLGSWKGFLEIFMPWKGGLASHGGAIALLVAMWWYAKRYGQKFGFDFLWMMDRLCRMYDPTWKSDELGDLWRCYQSSLGLCI